MHSECALAAAESTGDKYTCLLCKEAPPPLDPAETRAGEASEEDNAVIKMSTEPSDEPVVAKERTTTSAEGLMVGAEAVEDETPMELGMYAKSTHQPSSLNAACGLCYLTSSLGIH